MDNKIYDVVILGAGPAGWLRSVRRPPARLSVLILERASTAARSP